MNDDPHKITRRRIQAGVSVAVVALSIALTLLFVPSGAKSPTVHIVTEAAAGPAIVVAHAKTPAALVIPKARKKKAKKVVTQSVAVTAAPVTTQTATTSTATAAATRTYVAPKRATAKKSSSSSSSADAEFGPG